MIKEAPPATVPLPVSIALDRMQISGVLQNPEEALRHVKVEREILEDFRPISESLEWRLSDLYWRTAGVLPFATNEVPFVITNSGRLSESAAAVLFANCLDAPPGQKLVVLELGAGSGLFARYFLDAFRAICSQEGRDFYDRLLYVVSDRSSRTVEQWNERGLFADHSGHVLPGVCDALRPREFRAAASDGAELQGARAVLCNYMLDVLPSTIVRMGANGYEELRVRTCLTNNRDLVSEYTRLSTEEMRARAASVETDDQSELMPLVSLFELETAFLPVESHPPEYASEVLGHHDGAEPVLLNRGALQCLEECTGLLDSYGFVLINDYGPATPEQAKRHMTAQRFGATTALGVNFPVLDRYLAQKQLNVAKARGDDDRPLHARLLTRRELPRTRDAFENRFGEEARAFFESPLEQARQHVAADRKNEALESYRVALTRSPRDWQVVGEIAEFVGLRLRDFASGLELARAAVMLNPWYSTWLWNTLGDCLFCLGRVEDSHEAYLQAQRIDHADVRTNLNLSYTYSRFGAHEASLEAIALGLAKDVRGQFRDSLLLKQQQVLAAISCRWTAEQERLGRRSLSSPLR